MSSFDFKFVVNAGREVVQYDHFTVWRKAVLLLDSNADEGLDGSAACDTAHPWPSENVFVNIT